MKYFWTSTYINNKYYDPEHSISGIITTEMRKWYFRSCEGCNITTIAEIKSFYGRSGFYYWNTASDISAAIYDITQFDIAAPVIKYSSLIADNILFISGASVVLGHEIFGHTLERDNFIHHNYFMVLNCLSRMRATVYENTNDPVLWGTEIPPISKKRDKKNYIVYNGVWNRRLFGDDLIGTVCGGRRASDTSIPLPRFGNVVVEVETMYDCSGENNLIIRWIDRGCLLHDDGILRFRVSDALLVNQAGKVEYAIAPFVLECSVDLLLKYIIPSGSYLFPRYIPGKCAKKKQIVGSSFKCPSWILPKGIFSYYE